MPLVERNGPTGPGVSPAFAVCERCVAVSDYDCGNGERLAILRETAILGCMNSTKADLTDALRLMADGKLTPFTPAQFVAQSGGALQGFLAADRGRAGLCFEGSEPRASGAFEFGPGDFAPEKRPGVQ